MFCSNCGTEIADNANFCSSCGNEITSTSQQKTSAQNVAFEFPTLPSDLDIGKRLWTKSGLMAKYEGGSINIKEGPSSIILHKNGINIHSSFTKNFHIHFSQFISAQFEDKDSLGNYISKDKSVVGRAVVGTLIAGPLGTLLGALSGVGPKTKKMDKNTDYLVLSFWDIQSKRNEVVLFSGDKKKKDFTEFANAMLRLKSKAGY